MPARVPPLIALELVNLFHHGLPLGYQLDKLPIQFVESFA
jgi:hypothetical protein